MIKLCAVQFLWIHFKKACTGKSISKVFLAFDDQKAHTHGDSAEWICAVYWPPLQAPSHMKPADIIHSDGHYQVQQRSQYALLVKSHSTKANVRITFTTL